MLCTRHALSGRATRSREIGLLAAVVHKRLVIAMADQPPRRVIQLTPPGAAPSLRCGSKDRLPSRLWNRVSARATGGRSPRCQSIDWSSVSSRNARRARRGSRRSPLRGRLGRSALPWWICDRRADRGIACRRRLPKRAVAVVGGPIRASIRSQPPPWSPWPKARTERTAAILLDQYHGALRRALDAIRQAVAHGE